MHNIVWPAHVHYKTFASRAELDSELAGQIAATLNEACAQRLHPGFVVSGGRTPVSLFNLLARKPVCWRQIAVTLADERWVATDNNASNEHLVRSTLLQHNAAAAQFTGLKTPHSAPEQALEEIETRLADNVPQPFNIVLLGMGDDGHTASLFPDAPELAAALHSENACHVLHPAGTQQARVSLTPSSLLGSSEIIVHITGQKKLEVLGAALSGDDVMQMPVRFLFRQQRVPVSIYWSP